MPGLRPAANRLCDAGLVPSMLVHDGILLELQNSEQVEHAIEIMRSPARKFAMVSRLVSISILISAFTAGVSATSVTLPKRCGPR